jgi:23S rRNA (cytidine2498-2'-O)-methyltransferase
VATDKEAPSRAFAKLLEAVQRLGRSIQAGETCVDLARRRAVGVTSRCAGAPRVLAVDRAPLRPDLMQHPNLVFHRGDAFKFQPTNAVDWLLCDVIAAPGRSVDLLQRWVCERKTTHLIVTLKFKSTAEYPVLEPLKHALPPLCDEFHLTRLCANKNEVCAFGTLAVSSS